MLSASARPIGLHTATAAATCRVHARPMWHLTDTTRNVRLRTTQCALPVLVLLSPPDKYDTTSIWPENMMFTLHTKFHLDCRFDGIIYVSVLLHDYQKKNHSYSVKMFLCYCSSTPPNLVQIYSSILYRQ